MYDLEGNLDSFNFKTAKGVKGKVPWVASPERQRGLWSFLTWSFILAQIIAAEQLITSAAAGSESVADTAPEADADAGSGSASLAALENVATSGESGVNGSAAQIRAATDAPPANWAQGAEAGVPGVDVLADVGAERGGSSGAGGGSGLSDGQGAQGTETAADVVADGGEQPCNGDVDPLPPIDGETPSLGDLPDLLDPVVDLVGVVPDLLEPVVHLVELVPDLLNPVLGVVPDILNPVTDLAENTLGGLGDIIGSGVVSLAGLLGAGTNQADLLFAGAERTDFNIALLTSSGDEDLGQPASLGDVVDTVVSGLTAHDDAPDGDAGLLANVSHGVADTVSSLSTNLFG